MENITILDRETAFVSGNKLKGEVMENGCSIGNTSRKGLSDITNLQQKPEVLTQGAKLPLQPASLRSKDYINKLQQENMTLMKVLADRNKVIELSGIELKKLRINLEKFQQQNLLLAQANSQMLAELNSGKDMLKALKHELGCKNAVLKAIKLEIGTNKCNKAGESLKEEAGQDKPYNLNWCGKTGESLKGENKPCKTNRRRESKSLCPSTIKPVQDKEGVDNKRVCLRRQSARFKPQEPEATKDVLEIGTKFLVSSSCDDKLHESVPISSCSSVKSEDKEGSTIPRNEDQELRRTSVGRPLRRQAVKADNKRVCLRRQSDRFKQQEPEARKDVLEVDTKFLVSSSCDDKVHESGPISSCSSVKSEDKEGSMIPKNEDQELRRTSVGRPLRRAAEKVQSYKEIPLNIKMRREE